MSYPQQDISYQNFLNYVNTEWVTNGNGDITGVIGNNVVNALYQYISKSYLNWGKANIISNGGVVVLENTAVNVINGTTPTSIQWVGNIWNEYVIVNTKSVAIPITNGYGYYGLNNSFVTAIPANSVIVLYKQENDSWVQGNNLGGNNGFSTSFDKLQFLVGSVDSPMQEGDDELVITINGAIDDSEFIFLDGMLLYEGLDDRISYTIVYTSTNVTITFNQGVYNGQLYLIKLAKNS